MKLRRTLFGRHVLVAILLVIGMTHPTTVQAKLVVQEIFGSMERCLSGTDEPAEIYYHEDKPYMYYSGSQPDCDANVMKLGDGTTAPLPHCQHSGHSDTIDRFYLRRSRRCE